MVQEVVDLFYEAIYICGAMVSVIILPSLVVGVIVSMFQAATQINEQTMSFLPRLFATFAALMLAGDWLGTLVADFTRRIMIDLQHFIH